MADLGFVLDAIGLDEFYNADDGPVILLLEVLGKQAVDTAQRLCPVSSLPEDVPGALRDSIRYVIEKDKPVVLIGSDLPYAAYVEYGTSLMAPEPYLRPALAVVKL